MLRQEGDSDAAPITDNDLGEYLARAMTTIEGLLQSAYVHSIC